MKSVSRLLLLASLTVCLALPCAAFGQIELKLPKGGGASVMDSISDKDNNDKVLGKPCKVYTVELTEGTLYQIDMMSKKIDSYLRLEDPAGKELAKDDDSGGMLNARIILKAPQTGKYTISAITLNGDSGPFTLSVKESKIVKAMDVALADGKFSVEGKLVQNDARDWIRPGSTCKVYALKLDAGKTYQIDMMSKDIDSYLRIENADNKELARDDDSGDGLNARIVFNCKTDGTYRIVATTYKGGTGPYTLSVVQK